MLLATGVFAALLLVATFVAAVRRLSLARAFLTLGSALAVLLAAITGNVVGAFGLEAAVLVCAGCIVGLTSVSGARRRRQAARRRQARQLARAATELDQARRAA